MGVGENELTECNITSSCCFDFSRFGRVATVQAHPSSPHYSQPSRCQKRRTHLQGASQSWVGYLVDSGGGGGSGGSVGSGGGGGGGGDARV